MEEYTLGKKVGTVKKKDLTVIDTSMSFETYINSRTDTMDYWDFPVTLNRVKVVFNPQKDWTVTHILPTETTPGFSGWSNEFDALKEIAGDIDNICFYKAESGITRNKQGLIVDGYSIDIIYKVK